MNYFIRSSLGLLLSLSAQADFSTVTHCLQQNSNQLSAYRSTAIAVVDKYQTKIFTFGSARENQIFEIGSITKTFTANLLAQEIIAGNLRLSEPIPGAYQKPNGLIRYQHLVTHTAGLVNVFHDYKSSNPRTPWDGLDIPLFKYFYNRTPLQSRPGENFSYSNIGFGLLGTILSERAGQPYDKLVQQRIFAPLGMKDSYFEVPRSEAHRFPQGNINGAAWPYWNLYNTGISAAGGIRSTIKDMAIYTRAQLSPENTVLARAIQATQAPLYQKDKDAVGMSWLIGPQKGLVWHNGSTFGFNSMLAISSVHKVGIVLLTDTSIYKTSPGGEQIKDKSYENIVYTCLK